MFYPVPKCFILAPAEFCIGSMIAERERNDCGYINAWPRVFKKTPSGRKGQAHAEHAELREHRAQEHGALGEPEHLARGDQGRGPEFSCIS